jgi:hypothetical protein
VAPICFWAWAYELAAVGAEEHITRLGRVWERDGRAGQRSQVAAGVEPEAGVHL